MGTEGMNGRKKRKKLIDWFKASGLTYSELAERTGYSKATVCLVVRGRRLKRPFSRSCLSRITATLVWYCRKKGRDPRLIQPVAEVKCSCGKVHLVYMDGDGRVEVVMKGKGAP